MRNENFVHMHLHTEFSQLDGVGTSELYAKKAKELGFKSLAITDHGNIDGAVKWQRSCDKYGIKPIFGCEFYIVPDFNIKQKGEYRGHVIVLAKNRNGFNAIMKMLNIANVDGFYYRPRISYKTLLDNLGNIVVSSACPMSFLNLEGGIDLFKKIHNKIKDDFYFEIMPSFFEIDNGVDQIKRILNLSKQYGINIIATNDCHYVNKEDCLAQEVLLAIQRKAKWNDKDRFRFSVKDLYLIGANDLIDKLKKQEILSNIDIISAMKNTSIIADKLNCYLEKVEISLPKINECENKNEDKFLFNLINKGIEEKKEFFVKDIFEYKQRAKREFFAIKKLGFVRYFLIVWELVNWCKQNDILVGAGRGSCSGSIVSYLLNITLLDPIKYGLLFERFISEDRMDLPDIDIDFEDRYREKVRQHLEDTYGSGRIANISTFMRMKSRMVLKDVGRVFDINLKEIDKVTKLIMPNDSLADTLENTEDGKKFFNKYNDISNIALSLEGQVRGAGQHAAGIVISDKSFMDGDKAYLVKRSGHLVCNWDKYDVGFMGMLKLDVLALSTLSIFHYAFDLIKKNCDIDIDFSKISLEDKKVYNEFSNGNCVGIFQFGTYGLRKLAKELKIDSFDLLSAATALYRPAPLQSGLVDEFKERRNDNSKIEYDHEKLENILKDTLGIVVYQEQIMQSISALSGFSLHDSDKLRKALDKNNEDKIKEFKNDFVDGCINNGIKKEQIGFIWKKIKSWGGYGFNRSHAYAYSVLSYCGMWLKVYYPTEFICASLTHGSDDKKDELIQEAYRLGLLIVLPKIGISDSIKWIAKDKKLYTPFIEVKGFGEKAVEKIKDKKQKLQNGFFNVENKIKNKSTKIDKILDDIGAFDINEDKIVPAAQQYFSFKITSDPKILYLNLHKFIGNDYFKSDFEDIFQGKLYFPNIVIKKSNRSKQLIIDNDLLDCQDCELINECTKPVMPSIGNYNVAIVGEIVGYFEDKKRKHFVDKISKDILWAELNKYKLTRQMFFITSICKCWPSISGKPNKQQIKKCSKWIDKELEILSPRIILAFGNTSLQYFKNQDGGIVNKSGTTEWNEDKKAWICWCINQHSISHDIENEKHFKKGIQNFVNIVKLFKNNPKNSEKIIYNKNKKEK